MSGPRPLKASAIPFASNERTPDATDTQEAIDRTDAGAARDFAAKIVGQFAYVHQLGLWRRFTSPRWADDANGSALIALQHHQEQRVVETLKDRDLKPADRDARVKHLLGTLGARRLQNLLDLAAVQPGLALAGDEFDRDSWLLCVTNGAVDLTTGGFRRGYADDYLSLQAGTAFDAAASCPRFEQFLNEVFEQNARLIAFVQRFVGYVLTGSTREQVFLCWHGITGANGKSVLNNTLNRLMGSYSITLPFESFTASGPRGSSATPDLASLPGRRLVTASESRSTAKFDEARLKQLTGGDRVSARHLHERFFEFTPVAKLIFLFNDAPRVTENSPAFWRRALVVPFNRRFSEHEQDRDLELKLAKELPGILNWAIAGCLAWQAEGLNPPPEVRSAVEQWRAESDIIADFLAAECTPAPGLWVHARDLFAAFERWCEREHVEPRERIGRRPFSSRLSLVPRASSCTVASPAAVPRTRRPSRRGGMRGNVACHRRTGVAHERTRGCNGMLSGSSSMTSASVPGRGRARKSGAAKKPAGSGRSSTGHNLADPVTAYARDVVEGRIVAGRPVRLLCERHLRDLARQDTPEFPYRFVPARMTDMLEFFEFLTLDDVDEAGQPLPFRLVRWLQFFFGSLIGWVHAETGHLRFVEAYAETGKGSTKTPAAAAFGLYRLVGERRTAVEIYSLGVNGDQANYLYGFAKRMAERSDDLSELLDIGQFNLAWLERNSFFRPLTSEGRSLDNKRVFLALIDELHEHPTPVIPEKMRLGIKTQTSALIAMFTNAGFDKTSVCWVKHDYALRVLEGTIVDEQFFGYVCQLDPCEACRQKGATQPVDSCPHCDDWTDPAVWPKVNPAIVDLPQLVPYLEGVVQQAINQPSTLARVKRLNFCTWTQGHSIWIPADQWDACRSDVERPTTGVPTAAAFDMSMKLDLTGCVVAQRFDDPPTAREERIEIIDNENGASITKQFNVRYRIRLHAFAWLREQTLIERVRYEHIPYDAWRASKHLRVTAGPVIDHHQIFDEFVSEIGPLFKPQRIGYDPHSATEFAVNLRDRARYDVAEIGQGRRLSEYIKLFYELVRLRRIEHDGHPVLGFCIANAEPKFDRFENMSLEKRMPTKRIDLAIAAVMALSQVIALPTYRRTIGVAIAN